MSNKTTAPKRSPSTKKLPESELPQTKRFTAHDNLIYLVIERQAGTVAKSALEAVMNSIDAGATHIDVRVNCTGLVIKDNGKGFKSEEEIDAWFGEFGNPHEVDDNGYSKDARYGTFRSGRGQLFAFGRNTWLTNDWRMEVDVRGKGLDYTMQRLPEPVPGCEVRVDFYEPLSAYDQMNTVREITKFCKYVDCTLMVNGQQVNTPPAGQKWDDEDELAWVRLSDSQWGGVEVYQLGVFVETIPASVYGCSGTVVTKQQIRLNFARNQVIRSCPRWKEVCRMLRAKGEKRIRQKFELNESERVSVLQRLLAHDESLGSVACMGILPDVTGRVWSPSQVSNQTTATGARRQFELGPDGRLLVSFARRGDSLGDKVMQQRQAMVFDRSLLDELQTTPSEFFSTLADLMTRTSDIATPTFRRLVYKPLEEITKLVNLTDYRLVDPRKQTPTETRALAVLTDVCRALNYAVYRRDGYRSARPARTLRIGESDVADGWTDGSTYVAINRRFLSRTNLNTEAGWQKLLILMAHEYSHDSSSAETHVHGHRFYELFHELAHTLPCYTRMAFLDWAKLLQRSNAKLPKQLVTEIMRAEAVTTAMAIQAEADKKEEEALKVSAAPPTKPRQTRRTTNNN